MSAAGAAADMKIALSVAVLFGLLHLFVGYYVSSDVEDGQVVLFLKRSPTLKVKFENLYTRDSDEVFLHDLNVVERNVVMDYCKYRLGIDTRLQTQSELDACKAR